MPAGSPLMASGMGSRTIFRLGLSSASPNGSRWRLRGSNGLELDSLLLAGSAEAGGTAAGVAGTGTIMGVFVPGVLVPPGLLPGVGGAGVLAGVLGCPSAGSPGVVDPSACPIMPIHANGHLLPHNLGFLLNLLISNGFFCHVGHSLPGCKLRLHQDALH